jgi:hypothetical protein
MAYALGRRVEYTDAPTVRRIVAAAQPKGYRFSDFVLGVVTSDAFRLTKVPTAAAADESAKGTH